MASLAPGQLFDPTTFSPEQAALLTNIPGQSLSATNDPAKLLAAQKLTPNISVDKLGTATKLGITDPQPSGLADAAVTGAQAGVQGYNNYLTLLQGAEKSDTQKKADTLSGEVQSLLPGDTGRGATQLAEEKARGVNTLTKEVSDINSQILTRTAEYNKLNTGIEGRPITMDSIIGEQAQVRKAAAADIGLLQAIALGKQGQLEAAQKAADRAVDLKYDDIESNINIRLKQLELLQPTLTAEEKKKSDALQLYLEDQKSAAEEKKATDKEFQTMKIKALSNGMSASAAQKVQSLFDNGDNEQAYAAMSPFTGDARFDTGGGDNITPAPLGGAQETDPTILAYARQYASTGQIPTGLPKNSFARVSDAARNLPKAPGTLYDANTGIKSSSVAQGAQDGVAALNEAITKMQQARSVREEWSNAAPNKRSQLFTTYNTLRNDIGETLLRAASGGAVTQQEAQYYYDLMPSASIFNVNPTVKSKQAIENLKTKLDSKLGVYGLKLSGYNDGAGQYDE